MSRKILFVGHAADYTGAPIMLLHFLKWFKIHSDIPFEILLKREGALTGQIEALAPVTVLSYGVPGLLGRRARALGFNRLLDRIERPRIKARFDPSEFSLIYCNTVANGRLLRELSYLGCPVITHVHELENTIRHPDLGLAQFRLVQEFTEHYVAASGKVKDNLIKNHQISTENISIIQSFIPTEKIVLANFKATRQRIRESLQIPNDTLVVGGAGRTDWRKGPDLFIELGKEFCRAHPDLAICFLWIGREQSERQRKELKRAIDLAGLENKVRFLGFKPNPIEFFSAFDVFALTSREDSFPAVMLESACWGTPVLCFQESGGATEFVEKDAGIAVPYLDVVAMAKALWELLKDNELRARLGQQAQRKVQTHYDVSAGAQKIMNVIERYYRP